MWIELFLIAVGLSMDAFAVAVCKGLAMKGSCRKAGVITGLWFGGFQALMPFGGYLCGVGISRYVTAISKYVALVVLSLIGINMIREAAVGKEENADASLRPKVMFPAAVATSIDAFAVGVTLAALQMPVLRAVSVIGGTTFLFSYAGVRIGNMFGSRFGKQAAVCGGIILIGIGVRLFILA